MRSTLLFIVSLFLLAACAPKKPPPAPGYVQEWSGDCQGVPHDPEVCVGDIVHTHDGYIAQVQKIDGRVTLKGNWPTFNDTPYDGQGLSTFLAGLETDGFLGLIVHVVDESEADRRLYQSALREWEAAMKKLQEEEQE